MGPGHQALAVFTYLGGHELFLSIWASRITRFAESRLSEEQGGFRPERSAIDQVFALRETLLRRRRQGLSSLLFFIDFRKALDTVWHTGLWRRLRVLGVTGKAITCSSR